MKIGIIGSTGFMGENISAFLKKKNYQVKNFSSYKKLKKNWLETVCKEIKRYSPEIIINCSASQILDDDKKSIESLIHTNLYSQSCFVSEAKKLKNFIGFITFGSRWEYDENGNYKPNTFYAASKHASDYLLKYFADKKTTIVVLKIFDTYGINDKRSKILNLLLKNYKNNTKLKLSPGAQEIDYVNILDICELIKLVCRDIKKNKINGFKKYTVSSNKPITLIKLTKILKKILKKDLDIEMGALKYRDNESMKTLKKIFNYKSWKPKSNLTKDLKKIFD
jgi:nucleoside-diphosphate-sugar epimerase|tara:strand:- start:248 stop:1087 length:840 start_codon:yes stop_codon:yes gene_type:complete